MRSSFQFVIYCIIIIAHDVYVEYNDHTISVEVRRQPCGVSHHLLLIH